MAVTVFSDSRLVDKIQSLCEVFPWAFQQEAKLFESPNKTHFVLRIPHVGTIVIREESNPFENLNFFLSAVQNVCGSAGRNEIINLYTSKQELLRSCQRGGATVFRALTDYPRDIDDNNLVSLREILPNSEDIDGLWI